MTEQELITALDTAKEMGSKMGKLELLVELINQMDRENYLTVSLDFIKKLHKDIMSK